MNTFSKIAGLAAAALLSTVALATAADLRRPAPPPPPAFVPPPAPLAAYNWNGVYFGINGGWGWGNSNWEDPATPATFEYDTDGGLIGGTIGANWQGAGWVLGIEGDLDWADINGSAACTVAASAATACDSSIDWLGTGRIRIGMAAGNFLIYGTGGVAFGSVEAGTDDGPTHDRNTRVGWTAGAGVEAALTGNFSVKAEWLYYDLGRDDHVVTTTPDTVGVKETGNLFRIGLNWRM
ncbi:MAG: outer membrane beta-barrel protein [Bauldia sp.]